MIPLSRARNENSVSFPSLPAIAKEVLALPVCVGAFRVETLLACARNSAMTGIPASGYIGALATWEAEKHGEVVALPTSKRQSESPSLIGGIGGLKTTSGTAFGLVSDGCCREVIVAPRGELAKELGQ